MCKSCTGTCVGVEVCCDPMCRKDGALLQDSWSAPMFAVLAKCVACSLHSKSACKNAKHQSMWLAWGSRVCSQLICVTTAALSQ